MDFRTTTVAALAADVAATQGLGPGAGARRRSTASRSVNPKVNAFVAVDGEAALAEAAALDERIAGGRGRRPAGRHPDRREGPRGRGRVPHHPGLGAVRRRPAGHGRLAARGAAAGGRVRRGRQDQHPGAGLQGRHHQPAVRRPRPTRGTSSAAPAAPRAARRAALAAGHGAAGHRLRRGRLDPHPVVAVRALRDEAVARPGADRADRTRRAGPTCRPRARWPARSATSPWPSTPCVGPDPTDLRSLPMPDSELVALARRARRARARSAGRPRSATPRSTPRCAAICEAAVDRLADLGTEIVERRPGVRRRPGARPGSAWRWRATSSAVGHLRGTPSWERLDPEPRRADGRVRRADHRRSSCWPPTTRATALNLRLVELFHRVPLLLTPTVAGQTGPIGGHGHDRRRGDPELGGASPTRST